MHDVMRDLMLDMQVYGFYTLIILIIPIAVFLHFQEKRFKEARRKSYNDFVLNRTIKRTRIKPSTKSYDDKLKR